jgi:two-component system chemotaxis response regulator CheB
METFSQTNGARTSEGEFETRNSKLETARSAEFEIVVVGASTGGLKALQILLSDLGPRFPLPVVMVQHRVKESEIGLCEYLNRHSSLPVTEPDDKEPMLGGHAYLAPRDYHLLVENGGFALSTERPVAFARPSIDVLFESAADKFGKRTLGVILTGANQDGARGLAAIKARGGITLVEDPHSAACPTLPQAAIARTKVDFVLPLHTIASCLQTLAESAGVPYGS